MNSKDYLIGQYLKNKVTEEEKEEFDAWIDQSEANREEFNALKKIWDRTEGLRGDQPVEIDRAWNRFVEIRNQKSAQKVPVLTVPRWVWRAAAVLVLGFGLSYLAWQQWLRQDMVHIVTQLNPQQEILLPDGTKVWLNRNSKLSYPQKFESANRSVQLVGEAFFEVKRNEAQPFVITAGDVAVKVLGTSFNVKTGVDSSEVIVATGKVAFYPLENQQQQIILTPDEKGVFNEKSGQIIKKQNTDPNLLAWKTGKLIFENTPMAEVIKTISAFFNKNVELGDPNLAGCRINTTFDSQPLEEILEELSLLLGGEYNAYPDKIVITGQGCQADE